MKKMKNQIISSVLVLALCLSMLIGTTFAWFTDSAISNGNIIQTGDLDAEMYWSNELLDADSDQWTDASSTKVFNYDKWEPGYTEVKYVKVANAGDLNFKWMLTIEADGAVSALSDVIDVYYVNPVTTELTSLAGLTSVGTLTKVLAEKTNSAGSLTPNQSVIVAIAFHMDEDAGNEYKNMSLCNEGFSLKLAATQEIGEFDSFGDDYDKDATWGESVNFSASTSLNGVSLNYGQLSGELNIGNEGGVNAKLPADVKVAEGAENLALSVKKVESDGNISVGENEEVASFDVHIEGIAADNTVPMIVNLGKILPAGISATELKLYHTENDIPVLMARVDSEADFTIHNQFTYNFETGEVTIYVKSFSVFSFAKSNVSVWDGVSSDTTWYNENDDFFTLENANQFVGFRDLVDAGVDFYDKYVSLGNFDIDLGNHLFDPIGFGYKTDSEETDRVFRGTFNGNNRVIYNLKQNGWDLCPEWDTEYSTYSYSTAGGGLFASIENATINNIAISGADIVFECVDIGILVGYAQGICNFDKITIMDSKIANYNRATGAVVGEVCYATPTAEHEFTHTFTNITVYPSVTVSSLWGSFDTLCGGVIGGKWGQYGEPNVLMKDISVAAKLDVFSDVTAAYQWYAYRRCGMLIGHTEIDSPKNGKHLTQNDITFLTCENVTVYYGDWVNYEYYEYENQVSDTGKRYPWVRAQEGLNNAAFSNPRYGVPVMPDGTKITSLTNSQAYWSDYTPIVFNQLYGGGQGVYGCGIHAGVNIINTNDVETKTIYIYNSEGLNGDGTVKPGWDDLKLEYWYEHNGNTWSTVVDGFEIFVADNNNADGKLIYVIVLPESVSKFKILGTKNGESQQTSELSDENFENKATYFLNGTKVPEGTPGLGDGTQGPTSKQ